MNYLKRSFVMDRLKLGLRQSYRIIGTSFGDRISSDEVVNLLNGCRVGVRFATSIPHDLVTVQELVDMMKDSDISEAEIKRWCHRESDPLPHYRINQATIRIPFSAFTEWMEARSRIKGVA